MELDINDNVLLVGEANLSFSLSLSKYCDPKFITASCYESKEEVRRKYGADLVDFNINQLLTNKCKRVLFQIDACCLEEHFKNEKFNRIIFMFPHICGKSNLKKNRELIHKFLSSAKKVMSTESSVFIALAKGQGGTRFEEDPAKRNNKDSWQILQIAADYGLILTDCYEYNEAKFDFYKSTGFRSQSKSFKTKSGLVHRFEPSLVCSKTKTISFKIDFLKKSKFFIQNNNISDPLQRHPLVQISNLIVRHLNRLTGIKLNSIEDTIKFNLMKSANNYKVDKVLMDYFKIELLNRDYFLRNSLLNSLKRLNRFNNNLNVINGLVLNNNKLQTFETIDQLNNIDHELLIHFKINNNNKIYTKRTNLIQNGLIKIIEKLQNEFNNNIKLERFDEIDDKFKTIIYKDSKDKKIVQIRINDSKKECVSLINISLLAMLLFDLNDKRLLFSNDYRVYVSNSNKEISWFIKPYSIESPKWYHDISFWYDRELFSYSDFIDLIRDTCFDLVKSVKPLDSYEENERYAVCFRLEYHSVDRALSWKETVALQNKLRDKLKLFDHLILR